VLNGVEYFYGLGVQTAYPGMTHHGQPMETVALGKTELPMEVILEYIESLKETYTAEVILPAWTHDVQSLTDAGVRPFSPQLQQLVGRPQPGPKDHSLRLQFQ
jgi:hypothetical protein